MSEESCGNCRFLHPCEGLSHFNDAVTGDVVGYCRRYPPVASPIINDCEEDLDSLAWSHPVVWNDEWCGEWKAK